MKRRPMRQNQNTATQKPEEDIPIPLSIPAKMETSTSRLNTKKDPNTQQEAGSASAQTTNDGRSLNSADKPAPQATNHRQQGDTEEPPKTTTTSKSRKRPSQCLANSANCDANRAKRKTSHGQTNQVEAKSTGTAKQKTKDAASCKDGRAPRGEPDDAGKSCQEQPATRDKRAGKHLPAKTRCPARNGGNPASSPSKVRGLKRRRPASTTGETEEAGGAKRRRVSSPAAQAYALGAARRRFGRCAGSRSTSSAARVHDPGAASSLL